MRALVALLLAGCWTSSEAPAPAAPEPRRRKPPSERRIVESMSPASLAQELEREMRRVSPAAYIREQVVIDDALQHPAARLMTARPAMTAIAAYEDLLVDASRNPVTCRHGIERAYTCTQADGPLVILHFCRHGDWELVGFFVGRPGDPSSKQRYLAFVSAMQTGC